MARSPRLRVFVFPLAMLAAGALAACNGAEECTPDCAGKVCGDDGCGGSCGSCPAPEICEPDGQCSCTPDEAIHIEVLWDTPDDPDQSDEGPEVGADMDLHFLHELAEGLDLDEDGQPDGWYDNPYDCFWFNPSPQWGSHDPGVDDDPGLDRDDTDGAGPEIVNLGAPEDGVDYRIGVQYRNDHGFGTSFATVRIYLDGTLVHEAADVAMVMHDMWEVCTIQWPSGVVIPFFGPDGGHKILPDYRHPLFNP